MTTGEVGDVTVTAFQVYLPLAKRSTFLSSPSITVANKANDGLHVKVTTSNPFGIYPSHGFQQTKARLARRHRTRYHSRSLSIFNSLQPPSAPPTTTNGEEDTKCDWKNLTVSEFDTKLKRRNLAICFVGMSNCGKSHWSWQLQETLKFHLLCVDRQIEHTLEKTLHSQGHIGIEGLAAWMGFPSDKRFAKNQSIYLQAEESITGSAAPSIGHNSVLDTTGSVVYLSEQTREQIIQNYLVVHLEAGDELLNTMTENYFKTPKPVVWGDAFNQRDGESADHALRRCYPALLRERRDRYQRMSHISIPAAVSLDRNLNIDTFLDEVRNRLPA